MKQVKEKRVYLSQEDVPAFSLEEALRVPQAIFENFGKQSPAPLQVAAVLKLAPRGVQFQMLCGSSIAYGFTSGGYNATSIEIEPLAKRILAPTDEGDDLAAKREAFMRPRVIKEFVERYNKSPLPKDEIGKNVLIEFGVPRDRAAAVLQTILESAEKLGLIKDIKGKKYLFVDAKPDMAENGAASQEEDSVIEFHPRIPSTTLAAIPAPAAPANGKHTLNEPNDVVRAKRVFVTHGKNKAFVDPIKKLLQFGELEAIVSVERQSVSEPVPEKVMNDMRSCGAAIIHVEGELKLMDKDTNEHIVLNPNVLIEIGGAMALYGKRFILLVKDGVKLPSNLQGLFEVRYAGETLDGDVTIKLLEAINELKKRPLISSTTTENK
jgi:predicted nucleotide-binding protein